MARHRVQSTWHVDAPVERVWDAILDYAKWPTWWRGFAGVDRVRTGDDSGVGTVLRQRWRSRLPYTLAFDLEITRVERHRLLEGRASGPVEGSATWVFRPTTDGTEVSFTLDVRTTRPWMNVPVPFADRVFAANFGAVMHWGSEGLARLLGTRVVDRTAERTLARA